MSKRILIVEDEESIADLERDYLELSGFQVEVANDGETGLNKAMKEEFDLIILDLMLPGVDGFEICREVRSQKNTPIIMVSAKKDDIDKIRGLGLGADDYMTKPFSPSELVARVKAVLRRYEAGSAKGEEEDGQVLRYPDLEINLSNYTVMYHGKSVDFPPKEFELLHFLASNPKRVFTREQLLDRIWGYEYAGDTRTVDVHVKRIREKLNQDDEWGIRTVWSVGYKFGPK